MRAILTKMAVVVMAAVFFSMPETILAAGSDTLTVYASGQSLDQIINSDTTSNGLQAHGVYKLVSLDTTYLYLAPITVKSNFTVVGVPGLDGRLPCIQPGLLQDGSISAILFVLNGARTTDTFKNLYVFDNAIDNSWDWGKDFQVTADSVRLFLDNVIVEDNHGETIPYTGKHDVFHITNCKFMNGVYPSDWFSSIVLTPDWPTSNVPDSVIMTNNTFFCIDANAISIGTSNPLPYLDFSHNTVAYIFTQPLNVGTAITANISDNIFYAVNVAGGANKLFLSQHGATIVMDTINADTDLIRNIQVKDNIYYEPKVITDFWKAWDDTATVDSIFIPNWMDSATASMFSDSEKTRFPGFVQSGNLVNVNPGYGSGLKAITDSTTSGSTIGLLQYIAEVYRGKISTATWGYAQQTVSGNNWIPAWPLVEQTSHDLAYSATLTAPDGKPYGDPYWFTGTATPESFALLSNGASYTASPAAGSSYPDPKGTKLTDGAFVPDTGLYSGENMAGDPGWVGFNAPDTQNVVIDLGSVKYVQQFMGDYLLDPGWGIFLHRTNVSVSTDGATFTYLDSLRDSTPNDSTASTHKFYLTLANPVKARYIEFSTIAPKAWVFVDEYQVLGLTVTGVSQQLNNVPSAFALSQNYPNPFNPSTDIKVSLKQAGEVRLKIYNVLGQLVNVVAEGYKPAGEYIYNVNMNKFASGVYFYRLQEGNNVITKKMMLLK